MLEPDRRTGKQKKSPAEHYALPGLVRYCAGLPEKLLQVSSVNALNFVRDQLRVDHLQQFGDTKFIHAGVPLMRLNTK